MFKDIREKVLNDGGNDAYEKWEIPDVSSGTLELPTAEEIERIEALAYKEGLKSGYDKGFEKGLTEAQLEINQRCNYLDKILGFLHGPLEDLDEKVTEQLFQLAMTVAGQLIRRELHTEPGEIIAVVREAMASLPIAERKVNIFLHPDDASIVRDTLSLNHDSDSQPWHIIEDPLLSRGGCRLQAGQSYIDASVEKRLNRIIATLLGGERNSDLNVYADTSAENEDTDTGVVTDNIKNKKNDVDATTDHFSDIYSDLDEDKLDNESDE